jgi:phosphoadenosine phosphosulfate reductase
MRLSNRLIRTGKPPVALIVLDTLRADMIEQPGLLARLPTMRRLFEDSYLFTHAYSPSHWTLPSHASLFTGLTSQEHLARPPYMRLREDVPTIAELAEEAGYYTACITCNPFISREFGMTRGFRGYWEPPVGRTLRLASRLKRFLKSRAGPAAGVAGDGDGAWAPWRFANLAEHLLKTSPRRDNGIRSVGRQVRQALNQADGPPFLFLNLMEAHAPYYGRGPFAGWKSRLEHVRFLLQWDKTRFSITAGRFAMTESAWRDARAIYWENVRFLDAKLGHIVQTLPKRFLEKGFLILVSDHGQLLGEKGGIDHIAGLNERLIQVPLAIRPPGGVQGERVDSPIDITWIFHLLQDIISGRSGALGAWLSRVEDERSVISEARGGMVPYIQPLKGRDPRFHQDLLAFKLSHDHPAVACIVYPWKLICHMGRKDDELYNLEKDSGEEVNLVDKEGDMVERLHDRLKERFLGGGKELPSEVRRDGLPRGAKETIAEVVLTRALERGRNPVLVWTGGKDSTLILHLLLKLARTTGLEVPPVLLIDHGQHFPETWSFTKEIVEKEGLNMIVAKNADLLQAANDTAPFVALEGLDTANQEEALKAGLEGTEVPLSLNTPVGNHLLKTVALNQALQDRDFDMVITGIRWGESPARAAEVFFSTRLEPPHTRVHPILPWTEREVWRYILENDVPIHPLYRRGYRSFDGVRDSEPTGSEPAWEQDLEASEERAGRAQDKEEIMARLRSLGYF